MKFIFPGLTIGLTILFLILAVSSFGLRTADLYWKPSPWDLTVYSSDNFLIPSRIFWVPLYLLPHRTYEGLAQAILFTLPYWLIASALPSALISVIVKRLHPPPPKLTPTSSTSRGLPSQRSF